MRRYDILVGDQDAILIEEARKTGVTLRTLLLIGSENVTRSNELLILIEQLGRSLNLCNSTQTKEVRESMMRVEQYIKKQEETLLSMRGKKKRERKKRGI